MKIAVFGAGYVGLSLSVLLSRKSNNTIDLFDINNEVINKINKKLSPISDKDITYSFDREKLNLKAKNISSFNNIYDFYIIATPTNYDEKTNFFDTSSVEFTIKNIIKTNKDAVIVIKSTIPIGFTSEISKRFSNENIFFSPEFLREGMALHDNFYPSRIVIGTYKKIGINFGNILKNAAKKRDIKILYMKSTEAESVKLFANTYLAMRVSFFNELDTYSIKKRILTKNIIDGISSDPRIGDSYNNPSFGYGGYCLPKDVKQLSAELKNIKSPLIKNINYSNESRKEIIAKDIYKQLGKNSTLGIYKISMKKESDNHRTSAILKIIEILKYRGVKIIIYDPSLKNKSFNSIKVEKSLTKFKNDSYLIVTNRIDKYLKDVSEKVYTRDIYLTN